MELNILPIINYDGKRLEIEENVPVQPLAEDPFEILEPVSVKGEIVNMGGVLELETVCQAKLRFSCDRCMEPVEEQMEFKISERFRKEDPFLDDAEKNPDILILDGTTIDLSDLVYDNLFLNLPSKHLCREDCKGLCPVCGRNLNIGSCSCEQQQTDPRFDILDSLLNEE